jgi:HEAT repeat protein
VRWAIAVAALVLPAPLPVSIEHLADDEDPRVGAAALPSLPFLFEDASRANARLLDATRDRSSLVARAAIRALALVPDPAIETRFEAVLRSGEPRVVADVLLALALRRRLTAFHIDLIGEHKGDRRVRLAAAAGRAFQGDSDALLRWLEVLRDPADREVFLRWRAGENPLFSLLLRMAHDLRAPLDLRILSAESTHEMEMLLIEELESNPAEEARLLAARGLENLASRKADGVLLSACLRDPSPLVRSAALGYLVERGGAMQRVSMLESALKDPEESVRVAAARRVAALEPSVSTPILVRHLGTSGPRFFQAVIDALVASAGQHPEGVSRAILSTPPTPRALLGLVAVLARVPGEPPPDALEALMRHRWAVVRAAAIARLAPRAGALAPDLVLQAAEDPAADVRFQAARHLRGGSISFAGRTAERDEAVVRMLSDPSARVRRRAVLLAGLLEIASARLVLRRLAKDAEPKVARAARRALDRLGVRT